MTHPFTPKSRVLPNTWRSPPLMFTVLPQYPSCAGAHLQVQFLLLILVYHGVRLVAITCTAGAKAGVKTTLYLRLNLCMGSDLAVSGGRALLHVSIQRALSEILCSKKSIYAILFAGYPMKTIKFSNDFKGNNKLTTEG